MRIVVTTLAVIGALAIVAVLTLWRGWDSEAMLRYRHAEAVRAQRSAVHANVEGVGEFPLFLNPEDKGVSSFILKRRTWEPNETYWMVRSVGSGDVFVDVGANIGFYTVLACKLVGDEGHVYAFDPDPVAFEILRRNVLLNGCDNVTLEQKAASNEPGEIELFLAKQNKGDHRIFQAEDEERESIAIEAVRLDDYFAGMENEIDFIKVDAQGADGAIIEGLERVLETNDHVRLALEFAPWHLGQFGHSSADLLAFLEELDFRFFDIGVDVSPLGTFGAVESSTLLEVFPPTRETGYSNLYLVKGLAERRERMQEASRRLADVTAAADGLAAEEDAWLGARAEGVRDSSWRELTREPRRRKPGEARFRIAPQTLRGIRIDARSMGRFSDPALVDATISSVELREKGKPPVPLSIVGGVSDDGRTIDPSDLRLEGRWRDGTSIALWLPEPVAVRREADIVVVYRDRISGPLELRVFATGGEKMLPRGLDAALRKEPDQRTKEDRLRLRRRFVRASPALADEVASVREAEEAVVEHDAVRERLESVQPSFQ